MAKKLHSFISLCELVLAENGRLSEAGKVRMQGVVREVQQVLGGFDDYERVAELTWVFAKRWLAPKEALTPTLVRQIVETAREAGFKELGSYGIHPVLVALVLTELCKKRFNLAAGESRGPKLTRDDMSVLHHVYHEGRISQETLARVWGVHQTSLGERLRNMEAA